MVERIYIKSSFMNYLSNISKKSKDILPYFVIIIIYFFLISLENIKDKKRFYKINTTDNDLSTSVDEGNRVEDSSIVKNKRMSIPVLPFTKK